MNTITYDPALWQLVPKKATDKMTSIGRSLQDHALNSIGDIYTAMLATAPSAPEQQSTVEHKQGCDALGGYRHGVGACSCGAIQTKHEGLTDERALFEAWATKDGTYDLRPAKWRPVSHGGVPYEGYIKPYENDRTRHTFEGWQARAQWQATRQAAPVCPESECCYHNKAKHPDCGCVTGESLAAPSDLCAAVMALQGYEESSGEGGGVYPDAGGPFVKRADVLELVANAAPVAAVDGAAIELDRIKRVASCGTVDSFMSLADADKRYWFTMAIDESERRKQAEARLAFLHTTNSDSDGYEFGVARVKFSESGEVKSLLWGLSDHSDLDAVMAYHDSKPYAAPVEAATPAPAAVVGQDAGAVALKIYRGEICYKSDADDQSFGMWCPAQGDEFPEGTRFYTRPQPPARSLDELNAMLKTHVDRLVSVKPKPFHPTLEFQRLLDVVCSTAIDAQACGGDFNTARKHSDAEAALIIYLQTNP